MNHLTMTVEEAFRAVNESVRIESFEASQKQYDERSTIYDEQHKLLQLTQPQEAAKLCVKHVRNHDVGTLLDIGTGTGNVALHLRKLNFLGPIDLLDANMEMLHVASKKNLNVRNIFCHVVNSNGDLPLKSESYDVVTCVGSLFVYNLPSTCLKGILNVVKKGGLFVYEIMEFENSYATKMAAMIDELINDGKMELLETKEIDATNYGVDFPTLVCVCKKL